MKHSKKDESILESESEVQSTEAVEQTAEPEVQTVGPTVAETQAIGTTGNYILRLDGLVSQIQKELEKIPAGDIPAKVVSEAADIRAFGKQTYLFFMEKSSNPKDKIHLIDAVGIEDLSRKVMDIYGKCRLIDVVSQPVNKRPQSKKVYLAIFVGE